MIKKAEMSKKQIRAEVLHRRAQITEEERERAELLLTERVIGHQWFYRSEYLLLYASCGSEIGTRELINEGLRQQKKVYLPRVLQDGMEFYRIQSPEELKEGYRGILEPPISGDAYRYEEEIAEKSLMIMPGVAFDPYKNRIGYGKGYYDRYLAEKEVLQLRTIAVGFACQQVDEIPAELTDIKPYQVILV